MFAHRTVGMSRVVPRVAVLVFAALLFTALNARAAAILYDQPAGSGSNLAHNSSPTNPNGVGQRIADDFVLGTAASITDIHWWGFQLIGSELVNNYQFTFYADGGSGTPGTVLHTTGATNLSISDASVGTFDGSFYSADLISPFSVSAGTTYWVSIFNQVTDLGWFWIEASAVGNGGITGAVAGAPWTGARTDNMALQLTGTAAPVQPVPEPMTLALFGIGLAATAFSRRGAPRR
jgi:hypothetical protein